MTNTTWSLGAIRKVALGQPEIKLAAVRDLTQEEFGGLSADMALLRSLSGHRLIGALVDKLNAVVQIEVEMHANPHSLRDERFSYRIASVVDAYLGEITSFRSRVEALAGQHVLDHALRAKGIFAKFYEDNADYRTVWELRNSSQHGAGATSHFVFSTSESGSCWTINLSQLFAEHRGEKRWDAAAALWGPAEIVDVMAVFRGAYAASSRVLAILLVENELLLASVVDRIARAIVEGVGNEPGFPVAWAATKNIDGATLTLDQLDFEPNVLGNAIGAINGAREILGLPPSQAFK
ncbi:hypothetical protein [Agreia pratensis]|uniref:Uncharacterized protein n=1 Tax=Agreia pratensis TaxID=150121 RepID=A0A1X7I6Q8_9MICO|nr:hypothetical protein [Agreia pratensis]SMG10273.1 hypothetical protein SAMN06296010_0219 [Agreia pratensis]